MSDTRTPTPAEERALVTAITDAERHHRDYADFFCTNARADMIARMAAAGWVTGKGRAARVTPAGRKAVAPILEARAEADRKAALIDELRKDPEIRDEAVRLMKGGFREPWVMARNNVEKRRQQTATQASSEE